MLKKVLQPFITNRLMPTINEIVEAYISPLKLNKFVSQRQLTVLLSHINHKIMMKLFSRDQEKVREWAAFMAEDALSNDSLEMDNNSRYVGTDIEQGRQAPREP